MTILILLEGNIKMIKLEHVVLASPEQMKFIIEGMRNPMNSWEKSDSGRCSSIHACDIHFDHCDKCIHSNKKIGGDFAIGDNDHSLMQCLANAGTDHRKFMRMMPVYVRITAPLYWWKEFDTYKIGSVANSCSTMHKIHEKPFSVNDISCDMLMRGNVENGDPELKAHYKHMTLVLDSLNNLRDLYLKTGDKKYWRCMIEMLPSSYNQTRNVMMNYEVLANIYKSRKDHKLDCWRDFCAWVKTLPYQELITGGN